MNINLNIIAVCFLLIAPSAVFAMSSDNYSISADVIGASGSIGSSTSYQLNDTLGEPVVGIGTSSNFTAQQGFQYMVNTGISFTVDSNTQDFGTVVPGSSVSGQSTLTVTTDSWGGYDVMVSENHAMLHSDAITTISDYSCSIAVPCIWSGNGFGFTILSGSGVDAKWGTNPNYKYAAAPVSATAFHLKNGYSSGGDQTVVGYKVAPSVTQQSGAYSNIITYTALAKL
jgi:hypothetical protein